jgi:HlyD family secretion protein
MLDAILAWFTAVLAAIWPGLGDNATPVYNGYVEADFVYVAASVTGRIATMAAVEGAMVAKDAFLFDIDATKQEASLRAAEARTAQAEANLRNLETGGREAEIDVIRASLEEAQAKQALARSTLARTQSLYEREIVTQARVDADRAALESANAHVAQLRAQLDVAEPPAREEQLIAARATLTAARAEADLARSQLADMSVSAPVAGRVDKVFFVAGEVAAAGTPVVSILPPGAFKVLFFLPEADRAGFSVGDRLALECSGCPEGASAILTRMASDPQHTPPMIYSREERARLVFRAEARPEVGLDLLPGQPVSLTRPK